MPFAEEQIGEHGMEAHWMADQLLDYMRTWSAVQRYRQDRGSDPFDRFEELLRSSWGQGARLVRWPIVLRVGRNGPA